MELLPLVLVVLLLLALHAFGVARAVKVCRDLREDALVARGAIGGLLGLVGISLLILAIAAVWLLLAGCTFLFLGKLGNDESIVFVPVIAFGVFPVVHAIAEFLIHVGLEDAVTRQALHGEFVPGGDRRDE